MKTIEQLCEEELEEFKNMSKEELIEEIYRLRFAVVKKNSELFKLKKKQEDE